MNLDILRGKMAEKRITQEQLAEKLNLSRNSVSKKVSGQRQFTVDELKIITELLEVEIAIFFNN